ncbi:MAG: ATP-binding cassette domain-containing protein [candidate division WOR-3 bacterium]
MIEVKDLWKSFGGNTVLAGVSLTVSDGETITILGKSGSGKTVLLKNIVGLMKPDRGSVLIDGIEVNRARGKTLYSLRKNMGFVFQWSALFDSMTVYENVALPLLEAKFPQDEIKRLVDEALEMVEMGGTQRLYPAELSGGMRKRVGVARAIVSKPRYLFYDEPTTGLDPVTADTICDLISDLDKKLGVTSVVVTHDMHLATKVSDRIVLLSDGIIAWEGKPNEALDSGNEAISDFLRATSLHIQGRSA